MAISIKNLSKKSLLILSGLILLTIIGGLVWATISTPDKGSGVIPSTSPPKTVATSSDKNKIASSNSTSSGVSNQPAKTSGTMTAVALKAPSGTFVSNHRPNLSGSPAPSQEQSVCNTTPGAICYLQFTKDGITKTLPEQTTDSLGSAYWTWDVKKAGLTEGSWQIAATARLGEQTKTTKDPLPLEVQP